MKAGIVLDASGSTINDIRTAQELEALGVDTIWQTSTPLRPHPIPFMAAAMAQTDRIRFGTSILPMYPQHPAELASQVRALHTIAPNRFRLGVGTSHKPVIEGALGIPMGKPLSYAADYIAVLRDLLETNRSCRHNDSFNVDISYPEGTPAVPTEIILSTLSKRSFEIAGQFADGAVTWMCPVSHLTGVALPTLQSSAAQASRQTPGLIAHVPVAFTNDRDRAREAGEQAVGYYTRLANYRRMFETSGYDVADASRLAALVDDLVVSGTADEIRSRLESILAAGVSELLVTVVPVEDATTERREIARILGG